LRLGRAQPKGHPVSEIDLNSPEFKKALADAVEAEVEGLKAKNADLIAKNKKLSAGATIDPAEHAALEAERDAARAEAAEAKKAQAKAEKAAAEATKRADEASVASTKLQRDIALNEALAKAGVTNPVHAKAAKALLADQVVIADGAAKVGDKVLGEFITEWAGGDEGKHFVTAAPSSGGGSHGGSQKPNPNDKPLAGSRDERRAAIQARLDKAQD
jgi:hypothetical protein